MTQLEKQILDALDDIDKRLKKSERNNSVMIAINSGIVAMMFSTRFFTIEPNKGTAYILFIGGIIAITAYFWQYLFLKLKRKFWKSKK